MELKATKVCLLVMLFLGLSHTHPGLDKTENSLHETLGEEDMDITTAIMTMNSGSRDFLLEGDVFIPRTRNAMKCFSKTFNCRWPKSDNGKVEVPFTFSSIYNEEEKELMLNAMEEFHQKTCVRFIPRAEQRHYLSIEPKYGCYSSVGRAGYKQTLSLQRFGCVQHGVVQHELLHALGFHHEQSRSDRDQHVRINYENVMKFFKVNFKKQETNNLDTPYDFDSIMHYGRNAFSKSLRLDTITPIPDASVQIGQRKGMSDMDIIRINKLYECPAIEITKEKEKHAKEGCQAKEKLVKKESTAKPKAREYFKNKSTLF